MTDINKLREGLKCCIKLQKGEPVSCEVCPYNGGRMTCETMLTILTDAAEMVEYQHAHIEAFLKDSKPRVLTLDEAEEADICWLEVKGVNRIVPCRISFYDAETVIVYRLIAHSEEFSPEDYGKYCRLWSARPDDEQREAVKWE